MQMNMFDWGKLQNTFGWKNLFTSYLASNFTILAMHGGQINLILDPFLALKPDTIDL